MSLRGHRIGSIAQVPIERFLIVGLDSRQFAISAELVQGLLTLDEIGPVSTLTVQGQDYPLLDLADRLGLTRAGDGSETRIVLLAQAGVHGSIRVDRVHGLAEMDRTQVVALPQQFRGEERNWYMGLILYGDGVAIGLHSTWLLKGAVQENGGWTTELSRLPVHLSNTVDLMGKGTAC